MAKPLELVVYPPRPPRPSSVAVNAAERRARTAWWGARGREDYLREAKRLTDPELAAEYHAMDALLTHSEGAALSIAVQRMYRLRTLRRFATLPHYDEEGEP